MKIQLRNTFLYIRGPAVADCESSVTQMLQDHKDKIISLPVAQDMIGSIIGNKGSTIRRIVKEAGGEQAVRIDIDRNNARVTITGTTKEASVRFLLCLYVFCTTVSFVQVLVHQCTGDRLSPFYAFAG